MLFLIVHFSPMRFNTLKTVIKYIDDIKMSLMVKTKKFKTHLLFL